MARYISEDLRIRVIRAIEGGMSGNGAAARFGVSSASAVRWMDACLKTGRTTAKPRGGDRRSSRVEAQADLLPGAVEVSPDITLAQLRERLIEERGETFAISTIQCFFRRRDITFKKDRPCERAGRTQEQGEVAPMVIDGPMDGNAFTAYATRFLAPALAPGDIVILDDLPAHKVAGAREAIEKAGAKLVSLPPYSPDFNPIEQAFPKLKAPLRKAAARTVDTLETAIASALDAFSAEECANCFTNSGYEPE